MAELKAFFSLLMLAFLFNGIMYGIFSYSVEANLNNISCDLPGSYEVNASIENPEDIQELGRCEPEGLPFWYYAIWLIIDGALIYAFIPFVK